MTALNANTGGQCSSWREKFTVRGTDTPRNPLSLSFPASVVVGDRAGNYVAVIPPSQELKAGCRVRVSRAGAESAAARPCSEIILHVLYCVLDGRKLQGGATPELFVLWQPWLLGEETPPGLPPLPHPAGQAPQVLPSPPWAPTFSSHQRSYAQELSEFMAHFVRVAAAGTGSAAQRSLTGS